MPGYAAMGTELNEQVAQETASPTSEKNVWLGVEACSDSRARPDAKTDEARMHSWTGLMWVVLNALLAVTAFCVYFLVDVATRVFNRLRRLGR